jgi:hypothetical protein
VYKQSNLDEPRKAELVAAAQLAGDMMPLVAAAKPDRLSEIAPLPLAGLPPGLSKEEAIKWVTARIRADADAGRVIGKLSVRDGANLLAEQYPGAKGISKSHVARYSKDIPGKTPPKNGRGHIAPKWFCEKLCDFAVMIRKTLRIRVPWTMIAGEAKRWAKNEKWFGKLKHGFDYQWVLRWGKIPEIAARLTAAKARPLEIVRALAQHSENISFYMVQTAEVFVSNGAAIWNQDFDPDFDPTADGNDPTDLKGQMIVITHPELVGEVDESDTSLDNTEDNVRTYCEVETVPKMRGVGVKRKLKDVKEANRDVVANKSSIKTTIYAGCLGSGHKMVAGMIEPGTKHDPRIEDANGTEEPLSSIMPNGKVVTAVWIANGKGGSNAATGLWMVRHCAIPSLNANSSVGTKFIVPEEPEWRRGDHWARRTDNADDILYDRGPAGSERGRRGTLLADGLRDHFTEEAITEMCNPVQYDSDMEDYGIEKRHAIDLALKPPHTSAIIQGPDKKGFPVLKFELRESKCEKLAFNLAGINIVDGTPMLDDNYQGIYDADGQPVKPPGGFSFGSAKSVNWTPEQEIWIAPFPKTKLDLFDLVYCLRPAFNKAFSFENNMKGWAEIGFFPFNSIVFWKLLRQETQAKKIVVEGGLKPEDMVFSLEGTLMKTDPRSREASDAARVSAASDALVARVPDVVTAGDDVALVPSTAVPALPLQSRAAILAARQAAARKASTACSITSDQVWHLGPPTRGKGAALSRQTTKNKVAKEVAKQAKKTDRAAKRVNDRAEWIKEGTQPEVQAKLETLGAEPTVDALKGLLNRELTALIYAKGSEPDGLDKPKLAAKLFSLLAPSLAPQPMLALEDGIPLG